MGSREQAVCRRLCCAGGDAIMDLGLKDRVAFVAGSSRGIGKGIARAFLREGCRTVITGRGAADLELAAAELKSSAPEAEILAVPGDMSDRDTVRAALKATVDRWGSIDCVVANIGSGRSKPGWQLSRSDWDASFDLNLWPSVQLAAEALAVMTPAGKGSLVFIASITAVESTAAPMPYSAAKAALVNYAANLARVAARDNIRVNCVAPGNILFEGGSWERHLALRRGEVLDYIRAEVPQNRFGSVEEIADVAVFLSSDRAAFVTGACWTVDGGQTRSS